MPSVSVLVPTLNEERNLPYVFGGIPSFVAEVVLVDGGSTDGTVDVARRLRPDVVVVSQTRKGKGNALICGFAECTGDIIVMIDADGSTDPVEIESFVRALVNGADFAKGSRFAAGGGSHDLTTFRRWGNRFLNGVVNVLFGTRYSDLCYGYNAIWRQHLPLLQLPPAQTAGPQWGDGFEIETLVNIRVAVVGMRIAEVPSIERARIHGVSNLNPIRDGLRVLRTILTEYADRRRLRGAAIALRVPRQAYPTRAVPPHAAALVREET
jgi:glycosyltransferase involved in cell wall biosynthesis